MCDHNFQPFFLNISSKILYAGILFFDKNSIVLYINHSWLKLVHGYIQYLTVKSYSRPVSDQAKMSFILSLRYTSLQKIEFA